MLRPARMARATARSALHEDRGGDLGLRLGAVTVGGDPSLADLALVRAVPDRRRSAQHPVARAIDGCGRTVRRCADLAVS